VSETEEKVRLGIDRVACTGHGICAQTLLGAVVLDEWGYPIVVTDQVDPAAAAAALKLCPARALHLR
jgi:ferredoxin